MLAGHYSGIGDIKATKTERTHHQQWMGDRSGSGGVAGDNAWKVEGEGAGQVAWEGVNAGERGGRWGWG